MVGRYGFKDKPTPNLYIGDDLIIFGSVAFAKSDEEGKLIGLSHEKIAPALQVAASQLNHFWTKQGITSTVLILDDTRHDPVQG